jgi:DNA-binding phage protein
MTMPRKNTAFDRYFDGRMKDPAFASAYAEARAVIDSTDALVRALDKARLLAGVSKADLARQIEARPEIVRRMFTAADSNPTLATVLKLAEALGFHLELVPNRPPAARESKVRAPAPHRSMLRGVRERNSRPRLRTSA